MGYLIIGVTIVGFGTVVYYKVKKMSRVGNGCHCGREGECTGCGCNTVTKNDRRNQI